MEQLLHGLEGSAAQLANSVNTPPLDVASLRAEWRKLSAEVRRLPAPKLPTRRAVTGLWSDLRMEADRQQRSVFAVSSLLAVSAVGELPERARILSRSAAVALTRSGAVLSGALLDHYRESLREMRRVGFVGYGVRQLAPYTRAALAAFSPRARLSRVAISTSSDALSAQRRPGRPFVVEREWPLLRVERQILQDLIGVGRERLPELFRCGLVSPVNSTVKNCTMITMPTTMRDTA